jgi:hypothetical protein
MGRDVARDLERSGGKRSTGAGARTPGWRPDVKPVAQGPTPTKPEVMDKIAGTAYAGRIVCLGAIGPVAPTTCCSWRQGAGIFAGRPDDGSPLQRRGGQLCWITFGGASGAVWRREYSGDPTTGMCSSGPMGTAIMSFHPGGRRHRSARRRNPSTLSRCCLGHGCRDPRRAPDAA